MSRPGWAIHRHNFGGQIECHTDNRLVAPDPAYGPESGVWNDNQGAATPWTPNAFKHGIPVPAGAALRSFDFRGYVNSAEVTDLRCDLILRTPDGPTRWDVGISTTGHWTDTTVYSDVLAAAPGLTAWTAPITSVHYRKLEFNVAPSTDHRMLLVGFKPIGTITSTRYYSFEAGVEFWQPPESESEFDPFQAGVWDHVYTADVGVV